MINEGSFGQVFEGFDVITDEPVAIKTERIDSNKPLLLYEAKVLRLLESSSLGIPKIFYAGQEG